MELVINISDRLIKKVEDHYVNPYEVDEICEAILDGILLPKGHGRLIDADEFNKYLISRDSSFRSMLSDIPTIIEANRGGE